MTMTDLFESLTAQVGIERTESVGVVERRDLERFAIACGATPLDGIAPPLFVTSMMGWSAGDPEELLDGDGTSRADTRGIDVHDVRLMGAGQDVVVHEQVHAGTTLAVHTSVDDVRLKRGAGGEFLMLTVLRKFSDDSGRVLITCRESFIAR